MPEQTQPQPAIIASPAFSETEPKNMLTPEQIAALQAENETLKADAAKDADFAEKQADVAKRELALAKREIGLEVDALVAAGKVLPAQKAGLVEFMATLADGDTVVEFGEGDQAKKLSPRAYMRDYLASLPKLVDFGERSGEVGAKSGEELTGTELAEKAVIYRETMSTKGITVTTSEAVAAVKAGKTA